MSLTWYKIKAVAETLLGGVPDETIEVELEGVGVETIRFIDGFSVGIVFRDYLLFPYMNDRNPFIKDDKVGARVQDDYYWVGVDEETL